MELITRGWEIVERLYGRYASASHEPYRCILKQGTPVTIYSKKLRGGRKGCLVYEAKPI